VPRPIRFAEKNRQGFVRTANGGNFENQVKVET
jgi:hypothetical protein